MYFGTGWSLVLFWFPTGKELTVGNYYDQFVPQVTAATRFFTWMTTVMLASAAIHGGFRMAPPALGASDRVRRGHLRLHAQDA